MDVDPIAQLLPDFLNGCENFAEVIKENADRILDSLRPEDKAALKALLPPVGDSAENELYD